MLNVDGGEHVNPGIEQFFHILPAFGMAATRSVTVGQFVHQNQRRSPRQCTIEIELPQHSIPVLNGFKRQDFQPFQQYRSFLTAVGFNDPRYHVLALLA